jgi:hypothetical protein
MVWNSGWVRPVRAVALAGPAAATVYALLVTGKLTVDVGAGRRVRQLGPLTLDVAADRDTVFDVIAAPYLGRTPRALQGEIEVWERGADMVVAAHRTPVAGGLVTTTVESVRFDRPHTVAFRLLRGPVPHVAEAFTLAATDGGCTRLDYAGELGTDGWAAGRAWGTVVARAWEATVAGSLERVRDEAERRAQRQRR